MEKYLKRCLAISVAVLILSFVFSSEAAAQRKSSKPKAGAICGNLKVKCQTGDMTFQPHEIPFETPRGNRVIAESELFYAIVLRSVKLKNDYSDCETAISETERLKIQESFADNKVFAQKCLEAGSLYYTGFAGNTSFIAVYAGKTLAEANKFLKVVQTNGKHKGAFVRKTQAQINGT